MIPDDAAFIHCTACRISFYLELISELESYPLPNHCPFCGAVGSLDDLEGYLDTMDSALQAEMRRHKFAVLKGGRATNQQEDRHGQEGSRDPDVDRHEQDEGRGEGDG